MDFDKIEATIKEAMQDAADKPGRYGGRYVARHWNGFLQQTEHHVLDDDDPDVYADNEDLDVFCQATPEAAYGIRHARHWINEDGTVDREYFERRYA